MPLSLRLLSAIFLPFSASAELVVYYDFEGAAGAVVPNLVADATVDGRIDGALEPDLVSGAPDGASPGAAMWFDGVDDFVDLDIRAGDLGLLDGDFAVSCWVLIGDEVAVVPVMGQGRDTVFDFGFRDLAPRFRTSAAAVDPVEGIFAENYTWIHCAWVSDRGLMSIYWDGERVSEVVLGGNHNNDVCPHIGEIASAFFFEGAVDEFAVFDASITEAQIRFMAEGGRADAVPPAVPRYFTAPFGAGGTWNLYSTLGIEPGVGEPDAWTAQLNAARVPNPLIPSETRLGHLVWLETQEEFGFIRRIAPSFEGFWAGLSDNEAFGTTEGDFVWVGDATNPSPPPLTFTRWNDGQPDDRARNGNDGQDAMQVGGSGGWADYNLGAGTQPQIRRRPAVIEWEVGSALPVPGAEVYSLLPPILPAIETTSPVWVIRIGENDSPLVTLEEAVATLLVQPDIIVNSASPDPEVQVPNANTAVYIRGTIEVEQTGTFDFNVTTDARFALRIGDVSLEESNVSVELEPRRYLIEVVSVSGAGGLDLSLDISSADGGSYLLVAGRPPAAPETPKLDFGNATLLWSGVPGDRYQVEASPDLDAYLEIGLPVIGTRDILEQPVDVDSPRQFFRLEF